jgi:hypothetical protein
MPSITVTGVDERTSASDQPELDWRRSTASEYLQIVWSYYKSVCGVDKEPFVSAFNEMMDGVK